jgi:hypothetical protein
VAQKGDVAIFQGFGESGSATQKYGHGQMYNGESWVSSLKQPNFLPNQKYPNVSYKIYRP